VNRPEYFPKWMGPFPRVGAPWSDLEDKELVICFKSGMTIAELEAKHGRVTGGINSRLSKLIPGFEEMQNNQNEFEKLKEDIQTFEISCKTHVSELNRRLSNLSSQIWKYTH
jgi:hypothetical protein